MSPLRLGLLVVCTACSARTQTIASPPQAPAARATVTIEAESTPEPPSPVAVFSSEEARPVALTAVFERTETPVRMELETRSVRLGAHPEGTHCTVGGTDAECLPVLDGPLVITDYVVLDGCPDRVYLATLADPTPYAKEEPAELGFSVPVNAVGTHGAKLAVAPGAKLVLAVQASDTTLTRSERCVVTFTAYRPEWTQRRGPPERSLESPYQ